MDETITAEYLVRRAEAIGERMRRRRIAEELIAQLDLGDAGDPEPTPPAAQEPVQTRLVA